VYGGPTGTQSLNTAQETSLAPEGIARVTQRIDEISGTGEEDASNNRWYLDEKNMWEGDNGKRRKQSNIDDYA